MWDARAAVEVFETELLFHFLLSFVWMEKGALLLPLFDPFWPSHRYSLTSPTAPGHPVLLLWEIGWWRWAGIGLKVDARALH